MAVNLKTGCPPHARSCSQMGWARSKAHKFKSRFLAGFDSRLQRDCGPFKEGVARQGVLGAV